MHDTDNMNRCAIHVYNYRSSEMSKWENAVCDKSLQIPLTMANDTSVENV